MRVQANDSMLWKYFCIKYLCLCVKDSNRKNLQACNCARERQLNQVKPWEVKENSYRLSKTNGKSAKHSYLPPHWPRELFWLSTRKILSETCTAPRGSLFTREILSNQHWLRSWHNRWDDPFNLTVVTATLSWAFLIDALLVRKPPHHVKVGFIEGAGKL